MYIFSSTKARMGANHTRKEPHPCSFHVLYTLFLLLLAPPVLSKSRRPVSDVEVRQKKNECYVDIDSGLWGKQCRISDTARENCALKCLSPPCYELVYESDPLEEGEKDLVRSQEYKYCMYKLSMGEPLEGIKGVFE